MVRLVSLIALVLFISSVSWSQMSPETLKQELPKPNHDNLRGPKQDEGERNYQEWLLEIRRNEMIQASAAAVTIESEMVTFAVACMTALTLLLGLVGKYLIGPVMDRKLFDYHERSEASLNARFEHIATKEQFEEYKRQNDREHDRLDTSINTLLIKLDNR